MVKNAEIMGFLAVLLLLSLPFYILLRIEPNFEYFQELVASNVSVFLIALGFHPQQHGYFIFLEGKGLEVAPACVGWRSLLAFSGLVLATPRRKNKIGAIMLLPMIYSFNIFRLITSLLVSVFIPSLFDIIHGFLWTYAMTFLVLGLWWYWVKLGAQRHV